MEDFFHDGILMRDFLQYWFFLEGSIFPGDNMSGALFPRIFFPKRIKICYLFLQTVICVSLKEALVPLRQDKKCVSGT